MSWRVCVCVFIRTQRGTSCHNKPKGRYGIDATCKPQVRRYVITGTKCKCVMQVRKYEMQVRKYELQEVNMSIPKYARCKVQDANVQLYNVQLYTSTIQLYKTQYNIHNAMHNTRRASPGIYSQPTTMPPTRFLPALDLWSTRRYVTDAGRLRQPPRQARVPGESPR